MSLKKYDEALKEKLEAVFPNVLFADDEKALPQDATDSKEGDVVAKLPMISIYRINNPFGTEQWGNDSLTRRGRYVIEPNERIKSFPISIQYQIDIWSDRRTEVDDIWRELVQFLFEDPLLHVKFDDNPNEPLDYHLTLIDTDNTTDTGAFTDKGRLWRQTINAEVKQAELLFVKKLHPVREIPIRIVPVREVPHFAEDYEDED